LPNTDFIMYSHYAECTVLTPSTGYGAREKIQCCCRYGDLTADSGRNQISYEDDS